MQINCLVQVDNLNKIISTLTEQMFQFSKSLQNFINDHILILTRSRLDEEAQDKDDQCRESNGTHVLQKQT